MGKAGLLFFLFVGTLVGGIAVQSGVLDSPPSASELCDQHLDGEGWDVNMTKSTSIDDGTRLYCERGNRTESITVEVNLEVEPDS